MARVPIGLAAAGVGISIGTFIANLQSVWYPLPESSLSHAGLALIWISVALAIGVTRRASTVVSGAQIAVGLAATAFIVVALFKLYTGTPTPFDQATADADVWINEAFAMAAAGLAFGLAAARHRTPAIRLVFGVLVLAAIVCVVFALTSRGMTRDGWWSASYAAAFLAASAAARMEKLGLPSSLRPD